MVLNVVCFGECFMWACNVCVLCCWHILKMSIKSTWLIVLFMSTVSLLIFCMLRLSSTELSNYNSRFAYFSLHFHRLFALYPHHQHCAWPIARPEEEIKDEEKKEREGDQNRVTKLASIIWKKKLKCRWGEIKKKKEKRRQGKWNKCSVPFKPRFRGKSRKNFDLHEATNRWDPYPWSKAWSRHHEPRSLFSGSSALPFTASQHRSTETTAAPTWWNQGPESCWNSAESNFWSFQVHNDIASSLCH